MSVEYTNEFYDWWITLTENQQDDVTAMVELLTQYGTNLPFPYSSGVNSSRHSHMRELRVQSSGKKIRIFYAFDPRRVAILLIGGIKNGKKQFYRQYLSQADKLYDEYLTELKEEGLIQ